MSATASQPRAETGAAAATAFPCRIDDGNAPGVLVMTLGEVETPLAQGLYDPAADRFRGTDGLTLDRYYREYLGIRHFRPLDAARFPDPPAGWCSWYYYARGITPEEVLLNARWLRHHFHEYGLDLVLLDDGWQAGGRDWEGLRETFPQGMRRLADEVKALYLLPGLWLCPHGQENEEILEGFDCWMRNPDGSSVTATFCGPYTVDPTKPAARPYLRRLLERVTRDWGYPYVKLDGTPSVVEAYRRHQAAFADPSVSADEAFRRSIEAIREGAGDAFVCGCSGMPTEVVGVYDGQRTGADVDAEWENGFMNAVQATMDGYFLHRVGWFSDPDCCMLRSPLTLDMARAWATLQGLTGQMLLFSDRMPDLGAARVDLMKRILPVAPIRPFDLFPAPRQKDVFDLKIHRLGRACDVVALFNYDETATRCDRLAFEDLGLDPAARYHVHDYWAGETLGVYDRGLFPSVPPAACRLLAIQPEAPTPTLLSTSRHVTQGWPDLEHLETDADGMVLRGRSRLVGGEPYTLTFGLPLRDDADILLDRFELETDDPVTIRQGRADAGATWTPAASGTFAWTAVFRRETKTVPVETIGGTIFMLGARDADPWTVELYWMSSGSPGAFAVRKDGELLGYVFGNRCTVSGLAYGARHTFEVRIVDMDTRPSTKGKSIDVVVGEALPTTLPLSTLPWTEAHSGYLFVRRDRSVGGASLSCAGRRYGRGLGMGAHPEAHAVFHLGGTATRLRGSVAIEEQNGAPENVPVEERGRALFRILADGETVWGPVARTWGEAPEPFEIDLTGVDRLELKAEQPDDGRPNFAVHADWLEMDVTLRAPTAS